MTDMASIEEMQAKAMAEKESEDRRKMILDQILEPPASDRLTRLNLVKPDKARAVGDTLLQAAQSGQLKQRVTDEQLKKMLEQISDGNEASAPSKKKVQISRKKHFDDEDDDDDDSDLL